MLFSQTASAGLIATYGYFAIFLGTLLEGETIVFVAGFLAHQGRLSLPWIMLTAILGSTISDQGIFFLARLKGAQLLARFPKAQARVASLSEKAKNRPIALAGFALIFRFIYGIRNIAPIFLGLSSIPTLRFVCLNTLGAILWSVIFSSLGYGFANVLHRMTGDLLPYEIAIVSLLIAAGIGYRMYRLQHKEEPPAPPKNSPREDVPPTAPPVQPAADTAVHTPTSATAPLATEDAPPPALCEKETPSSPGVAPRPASTPEDKTAKLQPVPPPSSKK